MARMSDALMAVLRCPVTGSALIQDGEELVSSANGPEGTPLRYAIEEGIALLLPPERFDA